MPYSNFLYIIYYRFGDGDISTKCLSSLLWKCNGIEACSTDVVDLPDILLPAGQYLDLFDSESETDVPSDSSDEDKQTNKNLRCGNRKGLLGTG